MKLVKENISFERGLNAKAALGVGKRVQIEKWFEYIQSLFARKIDYTINDDLSIYINDSLFLRNLNISELPDNLTVNGYLDLYGNNITKLPNNLTVKGFLDLQNNNIKDLPEDLNVKGKIFIDF